MLEGLYYEISVAAARQQGFVTRAQATRLGADDAALDRLKEFKLLVEIDDGVFQLASGTVAPRYAYPFAAWLALDAARFRWERPQTPGDDAVLSHESAAKLHGVGRIAVPRTVFTVAVERATPRATVLHLGRLPAQDVTVVEGVPVTTVHRTIVDLVRDGNDHEDVGRALADAVRKDLVDLGAVYEAMAPLGAEYGYPVAGERFVGYFLADADPSSLSARNLRAYARLADPASVADVQRRVEDLLTALPAAAGAPGGRPGAVRGDEIAAEIVGRLRWG
ncbi:MAG: hypothetical protein AUG49_09200 [Catenulispora sp. 13_1_20CM_3_70_7]|nr:MAG: hypothetical protein AUG49_09200 [Catenulispora sp. 13_1_20CM_3_70_7]